MSGCLCDPPPSEKGLGEARAGGAALREAGFAFDVAHTSLLTRAQVRTDIPQNRAVRKNVMQHNRPVSKNVTQHRQIYHKTEPSAKT